MLRFHLQFLKQTYLIMVDRNSVDLTPLGVVYIRNVMMRKK